MAGCYGACNLGCLCCFGVLVAVRGHVCEIDGRVLRGMQFGVLEQVLLWVLF